jgi:hypothetical protein
MLERCNPDNAASHPHYAGRGITVCERWQTFENFLADMGKKPSRRHSIDRINNDIGYFKDNCRWVTQVVQVRNRRNTIVVEHNGQRKALADWADELGVRPQFLQQRYIRGLRSPELFSATFSATCLICREPFTSRRRDAKYCSVPCRIRGSTLNQNPHAAIRGPYRK